MQEVDLNCLKNDLNQLFAEGIDVYPMALLGINARYMFANQKEIDPGFVLYLREVEFSDDKPLEDPELVLELLVDCYLLSRATQIFEKSVKWLPSLSADQKQKIIDWQSNYRISYFQLLIKDGEGYFKDLRDDQEYLMDFAAEDLDQLDPSQHSHILTIILPSADGRYLAGPPIYESVDELTLTKLKKIKDKKTYEIEALRSYLKV